MKFTSFKQQIAALYYFPFLGGKKGKSMMSEQKAEMLIHKLTGQSLNKCVSWGENAALFKLSIFLVPDRNIPRLIRRNLLGFSLRHSDSTF